MSDNKLYFAWSYPHQKFSQAVDSLATSFAPSWQRMYFAIEQLLWLLPDHFPDQDLYIRTKSLTDQATKSGPLIMHEGTTLERIYFGSLENTLRKRKRVTFERYAHEIVDILDEIERRRGDYLN